MTDYYAVDMYEDAIREGFTSGVTELMTDLDPAFSNVIKTSMDVDRSSTGRDFRVLKNFIVGVAGAYKWVSAKGGEVAGDRTAPFQSFTTSTPRAFQNVAEVTTPGVVQRYIELVQGMGNLFLPVTVMKTDALAKSTIDYVMKTIKLAAMNVAQWHIVNFYKVLSAGGAAQLATVNGGSSTYKWGTASHVYAADSDTAVGDAATSYHTRVEVPIDGGRTRSFQVGQVVDIFTGSDQSTQLNTKDLVVRAVNHEYGTIVLETIDNAADDSWVDGLSDNDVIVLRDQWDGSTLTGPTGLEDVLINSGSIFDMSTNDYPQLMSHIRAMSDASLTETVLMQELGGFLEEVQGLVDLDTILTTGGVTREYIDQNTDLGNFERNGRLMSVKGGVTDVSFAYLGKTFTWHTSPYIYPGRLYCVKLGDGNWKRYVPPRISGTGSHDAFDEDIEFLKPLCGGGDGIWMNALNSSGYRTDFVEAPWMNWEEWAPDQVQGVKLTGLHELNMTNAT